MRIVVTEASPGSAEGLRARLPGEQFEIVGYARDGLEAAQMALRLRPDALIVHETLPEIAGYRVAELVAAATTEVGVVILVETENEAALRRAMASGARGVIALDAPAERYAELLGQVAGVREVRNQPEFPLVTDPKRMPVSIAITSAKGGTGKTTVAVNLAVLFARRFEGEVVLVDFWGQCGDAALALDLSPGDTIADLASFDELDPDLVQTHLAVHQDSSLRLLAAPTAAGDGSEMDRMDIPFMASLIGLLRRSYRLVLFDMTPFVWPTSQYVFSRCQQVLVVASLMDLATIRNTRTLVDMVEGSGGGGDRVKVIANRATRRGDYTINDLAEAAGRKAYHEIPDDFSIASGALNTGVPIVMESPGSPLGRAFAGLADKLIAEM